MSKTMPFHHLSRTAFLILWLMTCIMVAPAQAQIIEAENLLVEIDATGYPTNEVLNVITNTGSLGGVFAANGGGVTVPEIVDIGGSNGTRAMRFDGVDFMQHFDAPGGNLLLAPPGITGSNRTVTVEAWVINNTLATEETIVAWGRRGGPCGSNMAFNYGSSPDHGALGHWCGQDIGWGPVPPAAGQWHHLAYTFDGTTTKVFIDGDLANSEVLAANSIVTHTNTPITLAAQLEATTAVNNGLRGSLAIARLRIHDGVLSEFEVNQNYEMEKAAFAPAPITPLTAGPVHRYSFDNLNGTATNGTLVVDRTGDANATVYGDTGSFANGRLSLPGGSYTNAAFVDIPNGLLSTNSANHGGSGQVTFEGWNVMTGNNAWGRLFDFGSANVGEIIGTGTASTGLDFFILARQTGGDVTRKRVEIKDFDPVPNNTDILDFESFTPPGTRHHYAVTWDEPSGVVKVYENGVETAGYVTGKQFSDINDINNWLGRGQYSNDQVLKIDLDEFRIYDYVLTPEQVAANAQFGPEVVYLEPGPLQAIRLEVAHTNLFPGTEQPAEVIADYLNVSNINITASNITYTLDAPGIIQVSSNGVIQALNIGTVTLDAVFGGLTNTVAIQVVEPSGTLIHRYTFDTDANDAVGTAHGTLINGATNANGRLVLDDTQQQYVELPSFIISPTYALTVEAFVDFGTNATFTRLFDFGNQSQAGGGIDYTFFSPTGNGTQPWMEFLGASGIKDAINTQRDLNGATNVHVVTVFHPAARTLQLYLDGCLVAERNDMTGAAMREIDDRLNWIGRSLFNNDGYLNAAIDELRIYDGVLPAQQVAIAQAVGPDQLPPADPGNALAVRLIGSNSMVLDETQPLAVFGDFDRATNVNLCAFELNFSSDDEQVLTVNSNGVVTALREGSANVIVEHAGATTNLLITNSRIGPLDVVHRYPFSGNTDDVIGGAHGVLSNNTSLATYTGGQLILGNNGTQPSTALTGDFVDLPNGIVSALPTNATFECWTTWNDDANRLWQRIFDLGLSNGGEGIADAGTLTRYVLLSPRGGPGVNTFAYQTQAPGRQERRLLDTVAAVPGAETHYAISWNGAEQKVRMYVNGQLVSTGDLHMQLSDIVDLNNWLGRSQFGGDTYYVGAYNEFRIYHGAMTATDVADSFAAGPDALDVTTSLLSIQHLPSDMIRIAWPVDPAGFVLQSANTAAGVFTNSPLSVVIEGLENAAYPMPTQAFKVYRLVK